MEINKRLELKASPTFTVGASKEPTKEVEINISIEGGELRVVPEEDRYPGSAPVQIPVAGRTLISEDKLIPEVELAARTQDRSNRMRL